MNDGHFQMPSGRHRGVLITRVPVPYLRWMVNEGHAHADKAQSELSRRGTTEHELELSAHAIDRASFRLASKWRSQRNENEGLHSWLHRVALDAWKSNKGVSMGDVNIVRDSIKFSFVGGNLWPTLKTVSIVKRRNGGS